MEILMNNMPDMNPAILQTPGTDSGLQDKSSPEKSEFASLVENECSKSTDSKSQKNDMKSESVMKEAGLLTGDRQACDDCTTHINKLMHNTKSNNLQQVNDDIEPVNRDGENTDDDVGPGDGLKTGALLFNLMNSYIAEIGYASQVSTGDVTSGIASMVADAPGDESVSRHGLKIGNLLNSMATDYETGFGGKVNLVPDSAKSMGSSVDKLSDLSDGNGLIVGTLLNNLVNNNAAETGGELNPDPKNGQTTTLSGAGSSDVSTGNGLKVGTLLSNLVSGPAAEIEVVSVPDSESNQSAELKGAESGNTGPVLHNENGLKNGELLNRLIDRSDEKEIKRDLVNEEMASTEKTIEIHVETDGPDADSLMFRKEIPAQGETRKEVTGDIDKNHTDKKTVVMDMHETNDNSEGLNSRPLSGTSEQCKQESSTGDQAFKFAKGPHNSGTDTETNNITSINPSNTALENARSIQGPSALHTAKTPGVQELLDNVLYVIKGNGKMGVSVEHENFGKLNISLSLEKGMVNVHINTSEQAVREIIENNMQHIIDSLNKDGVSVGEFSVGLRDQREHEINRFSLKNAQNREIPHETKKEHRHSGLVNIFA